MERSIGSNLETLDPSIGLTKWNDIVIPDQNIAIDDDHCVGKIVKIRFDTGPVMDRAQDHITIISLNRVENTRHTKVTELQKPLLRAYREQSIIKIHTKDCGATEWGFKGFAVIAPHYRQNIIKEEDIEHL